jgi:signal transduction histidine kinase
MVRWMESSKLWKLVPTLALTAAIALLLAGVGIAAYNESAYTLQKRDEAGAQAGILAATVTAALAFNDKEAAQEYVDALYANREIQAAAVYDAKGVLFVGYARRAEKPFPEHVTGLNSEIEDGYLTVSMPVVQGTSQGTVELGSVHLRIVLEPFLRRLERYGGIALLVTMASLLVVVLGAAHAALSRANAELRGRTDALTEAYAQLQSETAERQRAEEALRQSQKMEAVGQLTGGVAHDFNNLLQAVGGSLELLERRLAAGRYDVDQYVKAARTAVNRAATLTQRLLAFSRRQPLSPRCLDLNALASDMHELIRRSVGESIQLETVLDRALWQVWADGNQIENALLNLAINARDAMPGGGRITIATANTELRREDAAVPPDLEPGPYVALTVSDTGTGMPPDVQVRAFEPFFTTKPIGQGTGLGLSQLYGFARQSGGHARIDSAVGRGTTVTLYLPRHSGASEEEAEEEVALDAPSRGEGTVLVVEDEALVRMLLVATLEEQHYTVLEAGEGETALEILRSGAQIDLLATDVGMPGMNGRQLAEMARQLRPGLKVLFLTGYAHNSGLNDRPLDHHTQLLSKPVAMGAFLAKVQEMIEAG